MDNELFEKAPIPEAYFSLAMPVVLSMLVTLVYNMVDTYFIAHTGNTDMVAGVSLTAPVFTVMIPSATSSASAAVRSSRACSANTGSPTASDSARSASMPPSPPAC
jgi:Na+-driven multidrug efflux pump